MANLRTIQLITPTVEVSPASMIDLSNPAIFKLIEQGGMVTALILVCFILRLLIRLIEVAKKD